MKKSIIAAAGGVLAAGFLTVSTPVAHAGPLCNAAMMPGTIYQQCLNAEHNQNACGVAAGCAGVVDPSHGTDEACRQSGICYKPGENPNDPSTWH